MNRREALKNVAIILGGTVISSQAFLSGCSSSGSEAGADDEPFSSSDIDLLDEIAETIIPATDVPGAKAAGVGSFMAMMVSDCYSEQNHKSFREGLDKIRSDFKDTFDHSFTEAQPEERSRFLSNLETEVYSYNETKNNGDPEHYFRIMKELILLGYFTSEPGCTLARRYKQTPGYYEACTDYTKGEKAWSTP